ncbi:metallophosphoesterase family protein [Pedobacter frigoris]|uniref:Metallophosphoesterase n=1 Tax=Pedobacter frigoris TaxID=2571272 RepID=A0A4U1CHS3_9SPHI|nr:metallophosphoesterase [Pedobacter frigoris]TKC06157.1 metallophosphoesterase [Pedobacter frigoris]
MSSSRREFIKKASFASVLFISGGFKFLSAAETEQLQRNVKLRFAVASDSHYGQKGTEFDKAFQTITDQINAFHKNSPLDFCVLNGDLIHNEKHLMPMVKQKVDLLAMPYYVTRGNHDMVTPEEWQGVWKMPINHDVVVKKNAVLLGDTSNEKGEYLSPDLKWLDSKLSKYKKLDNTFIFIHIPQTKWTPNAIDTPAFAELLKKYPKVKAVFHGHEHDQDGVRMLNDIPYLFDSHIGGNWGTKYKGFRVVELLKDNSMLTYIMNPTEKINELQTK